MGGGVNHLLDYNEGCSYHHRTREMEAGNENESVIEGEMMFVLQAVVPSRSRLHLSHYISA